MITVSVNPGVCGLRTIIKADSEDMQVVNLEIQTDCQHIKQISEELNEIDAFTECFSKMIDSEVYRLAGKYCKHTACPVPCAMIKAVEAAAGLALPKDVEIKIEKE